MESPLLEHKADGTPRSARYDDVYFSQSNGLEESRYVFLHHNRLRERFKNLPDHGVFTVLETGFGTGLNFLATWQLFRECAPDTARLVFISVEKYPLSGEQIATCLARWPELDEHLSALVRAYPPLFEGYHLTEPDPRVDLLLLFGDAADTLPELNARVDAWFLDGFAPSRNPDLWRPYLFETMARLSHVGTTAATFTSARTVYDGLKGAGFRVERVKGFATKRHQIQAELIGQTGPARPGRWPANEWHWPVAVGERSAVVVGAGLAGAHTAWELALRGWRVLVLEQADSMAAGASGNAQGAVYARLSHDPSAANRFYGQALGLAQSRLATLPAAVAHQACGLLQLNQGAKEARRFDRFRERPPYPSEFVRRVDAATADRIAGVSVGTEALHFPGGGWVNPVQLVGHRLDHPNILVKTRCRVTDLERANSGWRVAAEAAGHTEWFHAGHVVLASAWETRQLGPARYLPMQPIAGQVTRIASRAPLERLKTVLCSDRYLVPADQGCHSLGATFHLRRDQAVYSAEDDRDNLAALADRLPGLIGDDERIVDARAGIRCASPDYLPQVGPLLDAEAFDRLYRRPLQKRLTHRLPEPPWHTGLWVNIAHGSKGLCSIPLASKALAAWLNGESLPIPQTVANHLNPNRFIIRAMIRGQE